MQENLRTSPQNEPITEEINRWLFNRKALPFEVVLGTLTSALEPRTLTTNGGYLFKAGLDSSVFHLGFIPTLSVGERGYHYDIHLKHEDVFTLIGNISTQRELSIIFKNATMQESDLPAYRRVYQKLAQLLLAASPNLPLTLDWITTHLLQQKQIFPKVPQTLEEIACLTDSKLVSCTNRTL
ncbi:MAG: hypothetical protein CVV48_05215 [Spirochaetae bacterium HGW-Spirochaetae-4]|nr:MAG: hypothetical protein CVV48_05215 [Spirochaetae bacterium HGW-Spirochaetae-4]